MAWYIINENEAVPIRNGTIVGRDDFDNASSLSRQHFKFIVKRGKLSVRDLGSRNGTLLRGEPLAGDEPAGLKDNDMLQVGDADFYISWRRPSARIAWTVFAILISYKVTDPTSGFGRAVGPTGWFWFCASAGLATFLTTAILGRLVPLRFVWSYFAGAVLIATALDLGQLLFMGRRFRIAEQMVRDRAVYFCEGRFLARQCITQVLMCPYCVVRLEKWRRLKMVDRLEVVRRRAPERTLSSERGKH